MMCMDLDLCIPLYITAKTFRNEHSKQLKKLDLTFTQFIVMMVLWEKDCLLVREIGGRLDLDSGTLTPVLKKLEDKGYVTRRQSRDDARDVMVSLTGEGFKLQNKVEKVHKELLDKVPVNPEKTEKIRKLLADLLDIIKEPDSPHACELQRSGYDRKITQASDKN